MTEATNVFLERLVPAPPVTVFNAWLDPAALSKFMCSCDGAFFTKKVTTDPRPGGKFLIVMRAGEQDLPHEGVYEVIEPHQRLVFTWLSHIAGPGSRVTLTFAPHGDGATLLRLEHEGLPTDGARRSHHLGWSAILDTLVGRETP
ncbi:MAG: SRPBCC family protein [Deltaproteobacteria bacterium]|nr:SRPBCC family protein [Deltaproteobacteria bacterium]